MFDLFFGSRTDLLGAYLSSSRLSTLLVPNSPAVSSCVFEHTRCHRPTHVPKIGTPPPSFIVRISAERTEASGRPAIAGTTASSTASWRALRKGGKEEGRGETEVRGCGVF